jgi:hypothetical protein
VRLPSVPLDGLREVVKDARSRRKSVGHVFDQERVAHAEVRQVPRIQLAILLFSEAIARNREDDHPTRDAQQFSNNRTASMGRHVFEHVNVHRDIK